MLLPPNVLPNEMVRVPLSQAALLQIQDPTPGPWFAGTLI